MKVKFTHTSYRQPLHKAHRNLNKAISSSSDSNKDLSLSGSKGGRVERQRRQAREIDLELRNYAYR